MKMLFLYSLEADMSISKPVGWASIQLGISYISSILKADGHQTQLLVLRSNDFANSVKRLKIVMDEFSPEVVGFTAVATQYPFVKKIAAEVKKNWPDKYLVIGGVHATLNPAKIINDSFDAVCVGEGEYPTLELCRQLEANTAPHGIANLWIKSPDGSIEENAPRPFIQDIDSLPFPDRSLWMSEVGENDELLSILGGRGCPYDCTYCCNHAIRKVASGQYVRFRSPENIIKEVAFIHKTHKSLSQVYFEIESIALKKAWLLEFCKQLEEFNDTIDNFISYSCNFRISPQSQDEKIFEALKKANFKQINIGLESGSERIRREILKRNYTNKDFLDTIAMARKVGLKIFLYNIVGFPGETYDDYMETVSMNRQCQPDIHNTGIFFPYPGTDLHDMCVREGFIKEGFIDNLAHHRWERKEAFIDFPGFSRRQIQKAYISFNYNIYKGYKPFLWIVKQKIKSNLTVNFLFFRIFQPGLKMLKSRFRKITKTF